MAVLRKSLMEQFLILSGLSLVTLPVKLAKAGLCTCFHGWFVVQVRAPVGMYLQPITRHSDICVSFVLS